MINSRILVTGGSGFIGNYLVSQLLQRDYQVTVIDKFPPKDHRASYNNIDFTDVTHLEPIISHVDAVFHLAAMVGVDECRLNPHKVMKINYDGAKKLVDLCVKNNIKHFFFTSSSEVYGNSHLIPYQENAKLDPVSTYGKAKLLTEKYLKSIHDKKGLTISIVRLFNVYGPSQRPNFVVPKFVNLALQSKVLTVIGDGSQIRCFTFIKDAIDGIVRLFEQNSNKYEIVNIGNNKEYTISQLAQTILKLIPNSQSRIEYLPYGENGVRGRNLEIERRVPSVLKAKKLLGFEATTSLYDGIKAMIASL